MYPIFNRIRDSLNILFRGSASNLKNPDYGFWRNLFSSTGGISIDRHTALGHSAIWACIGVKSRSVASVPWEVMQDTGTGVIKATDHYLYPLINSRPSPLYSSSDFRETMQGDLEGGNAYAIKHVRNGFVVEFERLNPDDVQPKITDDRDLIYRVKNRPGGTVDFPADDMIHLKGFGNGLQGINVIAQLKASITTPLSSQKYVNKFYENGAHVKSVLETDGTVTPDQAKDLRDQVDRYSGLDDSSKTMLLEHGLKLRTVGLKPSEMDFINTLRLGIEDIARIWGVPLHLIGHSDGSNTQQNFEQLNINYVTFTIYPIIKKWEQEFNYKIFTEKERKAGYFVRFNLNGLMRGDMKSRGEFYLKMRQMLAFSPNDVLALENMNGYEGGDNNFLPLASNLKEAENENTE